MLKLIIFDAYGTLLDTGTGSVDAAGRILKKCGRPDIDKKTFYVRWKQIHREHIVSLLEFATEREIYHRDLRRLYAEYSIFSDPDSDVDIMLSVQGTRIAYPEAPVVVEALRRNFTVCVGSITDTAPIMIDIARAGMCFDAIFTSESLRTYKPSSAFYTSILEKMHVSPAEALFVGDSIIEDVAAPQQLGMKACWINRKNAEAGQYRPDKTLIDLNGLIEYANSIAQRLRP